MEMQNELDRLVFFEHARKTAETTYAKNPNDVENLIRWGGALLELAQFQPPAESKEMVIDAVSKLDEALVASPKKHDALWCMGNACTQLAFYTPDSHEAKEFFDKATLYYQQALDEEPGNELYRKSLEVAAKTPELHAEVQQGLAQQARSAPSTSASAKGPKSKKNNDLTYDICGWIILAVGLVAWVGFAKSNMPPPPPPR
ncbi:hypothetical protein RJ639_030045 [Escallonia herrerae]|uniref:Mitochondrial import receptor subunit TOM20 n=1 Tax=Escallonia herrerae TaxID=1293975 RepID=A0AA88WYM1_9ASTE|nr:hypothetical protein RJ639_030045 [Escallonia herrerae]